MLHLRRLAYPRCRPLHRQLVDDLMGCLARFAITLSALIVAIAVPLSAQAVDVFKTPYVPVPLPTPTAGTVVVSMSVFDGTNWATDQTIVLADPTLSVSCGEQPAEGA